MALPASLFDALDRLNSAVAMPTARLAAIRDARRELDRLELLAVVDARDRGVSWQAIADAVGISKQAAQRKWRAEAA